MRIAIVSQPWAAVAPPSESIAIWSMEVGGRLAQADDVMVVSRYGEPFERGRLRHARVTADGDWRMVKLLEPPSRLRRRRRPLFWSSLYHRGYFRAAVEAALAADVDVLHMANFPQPAAVAKRLRPDVRTVLNMRCDWIAHLDPALVRRRARHCDLILGVSDYVTERARRVLPEHRCETLHNGVDTSVFTPGGDVADDGPPELLYVGRVSPDKGIHTLLEAFGAIGRSDPEVRLSLIGDEALPPLDMHVRIDPEERVRALGRFYGGRDGYLAPLLGALPDPVAGRVRHETWLGRDELPDRYRRARVFVFPSVFDEPFGIPPVEAMASGVPVVATRVGGIPEVVEDGVTGILVPPEDPVALADAVRSLLDDPALARRMGEAGRRRAVELFDWDGVAARLRGIYERALSS
jgi:spore coat protein SA